MIPDEIKEAKVNPVTLGVIGGIAVMGFFIGTTVTKMQMQDEINKIQNEHALKLHEHALQMQELRHAFALDEVEGLRSDWTRENAALWKRIDKLEGRSN